MPRLTTLALLAALGTLLGAVPAFAAAPLGSNLGAPSSHSLAGYVGYYDGHKDSYLITDVSSKTQAHALRVNYSAALAAVKGAPRQFFVIGRAAPGQLAVFGSQPGESDYNPLWEEIFVAWKPGVTPVLLVRDNQIDALAKAGKLIETDEHLVLNAPITAVGM